MKTGIVIVCAALLALAVASCSGLNLDKFVRAEVPTEIQQERGLPASITLDRSRKEYVRWSDDVKRTGAEWRDNIASAEEVRAIFAQITMQAFQSVGPMVAGVPVLSGLLPGAALLLGYFVKRRGDVTAADAQAKADAAWDEAQKSLLESLQKAGKIVG